MLSWLSSIGPSVEAVIGQWVWEKPQHGGGAPPKIARRVPLDPNRGAPGQSSQGWKHNANDAKTEFKPSSIMKLHS